MITFWVTAAGSFGIGNYRSNRGKTIAHRFEPRLYDAIDRVVEAPAGTQIFSALDQATESQREAAGHIWDAHASVAPDVPRLNDPRRVLLRFDLLTRLHEEGLNAFRVYRADCADQVQRFPVFVRHIHRHDGPATRLLHTHDELRSVLTALRIRGRRMRDHMIVEFCDTSGPDGLFRKYAAFRVGNRIIACHVFASHEWCVKSVQNEPTEESVDEGRRYIHDNPHEAWLRRVFDVAGIDYGRVDYGVANGVPQVWEINLNPTIGRAEGQSRQTSLAPALKAQRDADRAFFHEQLLSAFVALDHEPEGQVRTTLDEALLARLRREAAARQRRRRIFTWLKHVYEAPVIGHPIRAVYSRFPRR